MKAVGEGLITVLIQSLAKADKESRLDEVMSQEPKQIQAFDFEIEVS